MLDMPLTLFTMLAVYGYIRLASSDQRWWYLIWAAFGLAIMTKHAAAVFIPVVIVLAIVLDRQVLLTIRSRHFWAAIGLAVLVALPWHFLMLAKHGRNFFDEYVMYRILWNTSRDAFGFTHSYLSSFSFLIEILQEGFRPWLFLTPFALILAVVEIIRGQSRSRLLVLEIILVTVFFTSTAHPFPWYPLPMYPSLAILVAAVIVKAIGSPMSLSFLGVCVAAVLAAPSAPHKFLLLAGVCILTALIVRRRAPHLIMLQCAFFLIVVAAYELLPLYRRSSEPVGILSRVAARDSSADRQELVLFPESLWGYRQIASFYSDRTILHASTVADLDAMLDNGRALLILLPKSELDNAAFCCRLDVHASAGKLVYATIVKSSLNHKGKEKILSQ